MIRIKGFNFISIAFLLLIIAACGKNSNNDDNTPRDCSYTSIDNSEEVLGYSILEKLPGIWNGPVTSSTPLGSFPEWIVDFRPISAANVSAKNELDRLNDIFMSFFIVKYDCKSMLAFRNGGGFAGLDRNSYMLIDSIFESANKNFYRFFDPVSGGNRVYSDVTFKDDSLLIHVFTNKYNNLANPVSHMHWKASLRDKTSAESAVQNFNFPKKELVKDFSTTFDGLDEAVFYSLAQDPYPETDQPYLGQTNVNVNVSAPSMINPNNKILIIISTQPLFNGVIFNATNLKYRSRYVLLDAASTQSFEFNYMHPGNYFVNALYDTNGDANFSSGDYINSNFDQAFTLNSNGTATVSVNINFEIP